MFVAVATLVLGLTAAACDGKQNSGNGGPPTATVSSLLTTGLETEKIEASVKVLLAAVQQHEAERVRGLLNESLQLLPPGEQSEMLTDCIPVGIVVEPIGADVVAFGEMASTTLSLRATQGDVVTVVDWHWDFERQENGSWLLSELPECPWPQS